MRVSFNIVSAILVNKPRIWPAGNMEGILGDRLFRMHKRANSCANLTGVLDKRAQPLVTGRPFTRQVALMWYPSHTAALLRCNEFGFA